MCLFNGYKVILQKILGDLRKSLILHKGRCPVRSFWIVKYDTNFEENFLLKRRPKFEKIWSLAT